MGKLDALSQRPDHGDGSKDNENIILLKLELFVVRALEALVVEGEEKEIMKEIRRQNGSGEQDEAVAVAAKALKEAGGKGLRGDEWREDQGVLYYRNHHLHSQECRSLLPNCRSTPRLANSWTPRYSGDQNCPNVCLFCKDQFGARR